MMTTIPIFNNGKSVRAILAFLAIFVTTMTYAAPREELKSVYDQTCSNVTSAGSISGTQSSCGSFNPTTLTSNSPASGGSGSVQYQWMYKSASTGWSLTAISGATGLTYNPGLVSETTTFRRCSKRTSCSSWPYAGESNDITITVTNACCNVTSAGSISGNQTNCSSFNPTTITSNGPASGGSNNPEYVWMKKTASSGWSFSIISGATGLTYDPGTITETTIYRRCARNAGCTSYPGETNDVTMTVTGNCCSVSSTGSIGNAQSNCGSFNPTAITSIAPTVASSGGTVEYQWMYKSASTGWALTAISGATGLTYDPGLISETTKYRRCARVAGCTGWPAESNDITMTVTNTCCNVISAGSISGNQTNCGSFNPTTITSNGPASGGSNNPEYVWMKKTASSGWSFSIISGATGLTYDPGTITETTIYRRCARNAGCTSYPGETNDVTMTVTGNCCSVSSTGSIGNAQSNCGSFNPTAITSIAPTVASSGGTVEYQWMYKSASTGWALTAISGATGLTYDPGLISETTKYRRCARVAGCTGWPAESNDITMTVTNTCCNVISAGSISGNQTNCGSFNPTTITSNGPASGGSNNPEYVWMKKTASSGWSFSIISGATGLTYDPGTITETTIYRRCARNAGCTSYPGETNDVTMTVTGNCCTISSTGSIGNAQSNCGSFNPTAITSIAPTVATSGGTVEYQWMYKSASTGWALTAISGATGLTYDPGLISETTKYRRCARVAGCTSWPAESNDITMTVTANVTGSGSIGNAQSSCGSFNPSAITSISAATGTGTIEYLWMKKTASSGWSFSTISGATGVTYNPGTITETTIYRRCARIQGCTSYPGESNDITMTVISNVTGSGSIGNAQSSCGSFNPSAITSISPATGTGTIEYLWMKKTASSGWSFSTISGATGETYNPGTITETTTYRRCARIQGCTSYPGESNDITMTVISNVTGSGSIGNAQSSCGSFNPTTITSVSPATGTGTIEYVWMFKNASNGWSFTAISGTNSETYDPGTITETTIYRRCARIQGCTSYPGESNDITMTVNAGGLTASATSTSAYCTDTITVCDMTDYNGSRTIYMPSLGGTSGVSLFEIVNNSAKLYQFKDGTAHYTGKAQKTNDANKQWVFSVWFKDKKDWTAWSAGGGLYKNGGGLTNAHLNWDYYIMDATKPNKMVGLGDFAGVELDLTHKPSNHLYAMQLGTGANDQDGDYGMSFWFEYTSSSSAFSSGTGDYNADAPTCNNVASCGGSATATVSGGTGPYVYEWSNGVFGNKTNDICTGTYTVTITDANGCSSTASTTVSTTVCCNNILPGTIGADQSSCGSFDPSAITTLTPATGGGASIEYIWMKKSSSTGNVWVLMPSETAETFDPGLLTETTSYRRCARNQGCTPYPAESNVITMSVYPSPTATSSSTDVVCNSAADGTGSMSVSGGTTPYTYSWDNGATTASLSNLAPGTYVGTATDANGCTITETITITEPTLLTSSSNGTNVTGNGVADGSASVTAAGGTSPYAYLWSDGQTTSTATGLVAGTYTVTVTDANGCTTTETVVITEPSALTSSITDVDVLCNGNSTGSASVTVTGGTSPYTYLWSNGATTSSITGLTAGTYTVTATDANGYTTTSTTTVTEPSALTSSSSSTDVVCNSAADGTGSMSVSGGTTPYTYSWDNGATTASLSNLAPGTYVGTATDANGCTITETITITEPTLLTSSSNGTNVTGNGVADGSASVTAAGGTSPYAYLWSDGQTTSTATGLVAGTYTVTVTDANGCTTTETVVITEPSALTSSITDVDVLCNSDATGSASVTVTGGTSPYTYLWSNGATTSSITGLTAGTYTVTATDANGYTTTSTTTVTEPSALTSSSSSTDVVCNSAADGTGSMSVSGGVMPYTYSWDNGATTASLSNLAPGTYVGTATDANGCTITETITITEPTLLTSSSNGTNVTGNGVADGSASVTAAGGTSPYAYLWSDGQTTSTATGLVAGTYTVTVTDANGCTTTETVVITEPSALTSSITDVDVLCNSDATGSASVTVTGGTSPYTYLWSNGATTSSITGLTAGTYTVTATDANGYTTTSTTTVTEPSALTSSSSSTDVVCNSAADGTGSMSVSGGVMPYTYSWDNGATTASLSNLAPGTYVGTATDANGCTITETITITEPTLLTSSSNGTNVTGNGVADGSASVTAAGGTSPYAYLWSDGQTTSTATGLVAGTYTVTVTDANGCTTTETVVITEPSALTSSITDVDVLCNSDATGSASVTVTGGTSPYTYLWSNGATTSSITGLTAGTYTVTATDANGYTTTSTTTVTEPSALTSSSSSTDVVCNSAADGTGSMSVSGGVMPYTYSWDNGATTASLSNLAPGTYVGTATDANGCTITETITITEPTLLTSSSNGTNVTGNGVADGSASVTAAGGTSPYAYLWSDGQTTSTATGLVAGTYTVTVTDANGCTTTETVVITEPSALTSSITDVDVLCNSDATGSASVTVTGGTSPYTYLWSNGATTSSITGLTAGTYTVTATDANGYTTTSTTTVTEPSALTSSSSSTDVVCNSAADGTGSMSVSGGVMPYTYSWDNGATTASLSNLAPGTYVGTATDANGCTITETITITEPTLLTSSSNGTNVTGNGVADGSASVTAAGGTSPYAYLWSDGQTTSTATGLVAGTYTVTVTDANGCTTTETVVITEPSALTSSITDVDVLCNSDATGSASVTVTGGTSPYTYLWSNGATTSSITGLTAGTYTVTATDANGYTTTSTTTVTEPSALTSSSSSTDVVCNSAADGTGSMSVSGGVMPYTYSWDNGATTASLSNLAPGTYVGTATDANGCTITETITITEPTLLTSSSNGTNVTGNGVADGSASVTAAGGTSPYAYLWSDGQTTSTATGLVAGTYTVTVTDANGCTTTETVVITEPSALTSSITDVDVLCNGNSTGSASVTVTGGTSPYTYLWSNGATTSSITGLTAGTYTVTATDANGYTTTSTTTVTEPSALTSSSSSTDVVCNSAADGTGSMSVSGGTTPYTYSWDNGATTASLSNLAPGTYVGTATDANGCTITETITITEPTLLTSSSNGTNVTGNGVADGSASVTAAGGTSPYAYLWSDGQTTSTATGLVAGTYTVTVTDANGCTTTETVVITEPSALTSSITDVDVLCNGNSTGSASVTVTGGTSPYTYLWSNGATTSSITGLTAGTYTVTATDANGYTTTSTTTVTEPSALTSSSSSTDVVCNSAADGTGSMSVSGGTTPYTYSWDNGATTASLSNLAPGTYVGTATDANGCTITETITITEPTLLTSSSNGTNVTGNGVADGSASVTAAGGTSPYAYLWSDGQTTSTATGLVAGTYTVTVTDANGCTTTETVVITEPSALTSSITDVDVLCNSDATGSASVTVTGGTSPYTYLWSNGATTSSITGLTAGTYTVTATDANGYTTTSTTTVTEPSALTNASTSVSNVTCNGANDGSVVLSVSGGVMPYTYSWSNGATTADLTAVGPGTYTVTVTDANGCTISETETITEPNVLALVNVVTADVSCFGTPTGSVSLSTTGGTSPYTYLWSDGQTTQNATGLVAGTYTVTVTDANGCTETESNILIGEPAVLETETVSSTNVTCFGACDGIASISVDGGTLPYTYLWSDGQTSPAATGFCPGTYSVTVTDANGCSITENNIVITEPAVLANSNTTVSDVTCNGLSDGSITLSMTGGTSPYTYLWSDGQTTATATGLVAGTYSVTVTDANGCTEDVNNVTVAEPNVLANSLTTIVNTSCFGSCDGSVTVNVTGGTAPYTYAWSQVILNQFTGDGTPTISDLCKGMYSVVITDANGCTISVDSVEVTEPSPIFNNNTTISNVSCNGASDGTIVLDILGGTLPYTYLWSNGQTTADATGLSAGTYSVTVTDANGCVFTTAGSIITEPLPLANGSTGVINVTCNGLSDGSISLNVSGGTLPYTYAWSNGQTTASATGLAMGTYSVTVTDANGCTIDVNNITVSEPAALAIPAPTVVNATCFGTCDGSISINVTGGTAPYTYDWSEIVINQIDGDGTPTVTNLCKGLYSVLVTDDNGCTISLDSIEITEPTPIFEDNSVITNVTCNGSSDGAIDLNIVGGTAPYTFAWDNGSTGQSITGLTAGTYSATVTDANGCTLDVTNVFVGEPLALGVGNTTIGDVTCNSSCNGSIQLSIVGGTMPYTYDWTNGATTENLSGLCAGTYSVTVTDANGCAIDVNNITVNEPTALSAVFTATDVQCYTACDGEIVTNVMGGVAPYTYSWSNGATSADIANLCNATYVLTVTDSNGCTLVDSVVISQPEELKVTASSTDVSCFGECDGTGNALITGGVLPYNVLWSNGDSLVNIDSLCPGSYTITVSDTNNCISSASIVVGEPTEIQVSFAIDYNMAMITATASNGVPTYTYAWDNGTTGSVISNIGNGTYFVTATDLNGCSVTDSVIYIEGGGIINQFTLNVGPNPFAGQTMMSISTTQTDQISVDLFDVSGNVIEETFDGVLEANTALELTISANSLEPGIYLARVLASDGSSMSKKLVITE